MVDRLGSATVLRMDRFEITFLDSYTDEALLAELRRVAALLPSGPLTRAVFKQFSKRVSVSTLQRRFGGWRQALEAAGEGHLYGGRVVSGKMRSQDARSMSDPDLILELRRVHALVGLPTLTTEDFNKHSVRTCYTAIRRRFGSWPKALKKAGIGLSNMGRRYTDKECFENLVNVWTHYGRQPYYEEINHPPSVVGVGAYVVRWGGWRKALNAFVEWANTEDKNTESLPEPQLEKSERRSLSPEDRHAVPLRLKWKVHLRDHFRCVACGRSPANDLTVELHADHINPHADGGKTLLDNLQTLCKDCNLGKGKSHAEVR